MDALIVFDDGHGPALFVGGRFSSAGGLSAGGIVRWDGRAWSALTGTCGDVVMTGVKALAVYDDGTGPALYVGSDGTFVGCEDEYASLLRWNGTSWSTPPGSDVLAPGDSNVAALTVFDDGSGAGLYAGIEWNDAVSFLFRWDGTWSELPLSGRINGGAYALAVFDDGSGPALYVGGVDLTSAGDTPIENVARWDGRAWSPLPGVSGGIETLGVFDDGSGPALYAGGSLAFARWTGGGWAVPSAAGEGLSDEVHALAIYDDGTGPALYAGGKFAVAGGIVVNGVARWGGDHWSALVGPHGTGVDGWVDSLAVYDDGSGPALFVGGGFEMAGGVPANSIARWDGKEWSRLSDPGGNGVSPGDANITGFVVSLALAVYDDGSGPALFVGGDFGVAGGQPAHGLARWDGSGWSIPPGLPTPNRFGTVPEVHALSVYDDGSGPALFVGGRFDTVAGITANSIARWNGDDWSVLSGPHGTGITYGNDSSGIVDALTAYDDGHAQALYVGGSFATAGGLDAHGLARWDGRAWSSFSDPLGNAFPGMAYSLAVFDDGTGPALYVGGAFDGGGGTAASNIARWDGHGWSDLSGPTGNGTDRPVRALLPFTGASGPMLYAGGEFTLAGGIPSSHLAVWVPAVPPPPGPWLENEELSGFRVKARISAGGSTIAGKTVTPCIGETLCIAGALPDRAELFVRVVGPKPNGRLWPTLVKFSTSRVEVWLEQSATGTVRYYDLPAVTPGATLLTLDGLADKVGFGSAAAGVTALDVSATNAPPAQPLVLGAVLSGASSPATRVAGPAPPDGPWLRTSALPGFRTKVRILNGGASLVGQEVMRCIGETLCVAGALSDRAELFVRVVGPKPNGRLWPTLVKFSTSRVEVWIEQTASGTMRYYDLPAVEPGESPLTLDGLADKDGFAP